VLVLLWFVLGLSAHWISRFMGGGGTLRGTLGAVGLGWSVPLLLFLVLPDLAIYTWGGMDAMRWAVRIVGPLTVAGCWAGTTLALTQAHPSLSKGQARAAALMALTIAGLVGGPFLR